MPGGRHRLRRMDGSPRPRFFTPRSSESQASPAAASPGTPSQLSSPGSALNKAGRRPLSSTVEKQSEDAIAEFSAAEGKTDYFSTHGSPAFLRCLSRWIPAIAAKDGAASSGKFVESKKNLQIIEASNKAYAKWASTAAHKGQAFLEEFDRMMNFEATAPASTLVLPPLLYRTRVQALIEASVSSKDLVAAIVASAG